MEILFNPLNLDNPCSVLLFMILWNWF
jgi:hypothetical protein